jgi:hypothetical protein
MTGNRDRNLGTTVTVSFQISCRRFPQNLVAFERHGPVIRSQKWAGTNRHDKFVGKIARIIVESHIVPMAEFTIVTRNSSKGVDPGVDCRCRPRSH